MDRRQKIVLGVVVVAGLELIALLIVDRISPDAASVMASIYVALGLFAVAWIALNWRNRP